MTDLDELERLAKAAGGDAWTPTYATRIDLAAVWLPDGDSVCRCYGNIGHLPEPIDADLLAEYIAAANPATILALTSEARRLRADLDGAIEMANKNALDASRWQHIYDCGYIICRVLKDGTVQNLGGSYVGKYAVDDLITAVKAAHPKEGA